MKGLTLDSYAAKVRSEVFRHTSKWLGLKTKGLPPRLRSCVLEYHERKGKALRPIFLCLFGDGLGAAREHSLRVAAACELLENWGLGRDDLVDHSFMRRGKPALHRIYGQEITINALDLLQTYVPEMLYAYCGLPGGLYGSVLEEFYGSVRKSLSGQHLELEWRARSLSRFTAGSYFSVAARKTASYTTIGTARLAALLAGRKDLYGPIGRFGLALGKSFQLMDDVLDVEHDGTGPFGKSVANDIAEGKRTLVALTAYQLAGPAEKKRLNALYDLPAGRKTATDLVWARQLFLSSGAAASCREKAAGLASAALTIFEKELRPEMRKPYGGLLGEFVLMLKSRTA